MIEYKIYCAGKFISSSKKLEVINKYSKGIYATSYLADKEILELAITGALAAKEKCKQLSSHEKFIALKYIAEEIEKNKNYLAEVLCIESAKPIRYAIAEIERAAQTFLIAAEECKRLPKEYLSLDWTPNGKSKEGIINYFPIGLVAGISPFNFPLNLAVHKIAPAIAAGCPIILKPASSTPLSTLELAKIIDRTYLPKGAVSILPMDRITGNLLVTDERFNLLSFTGSPIVGWPMKAQCGKKKIILELGGNAGVIISETANLNEIINKCVGGAFAYSGQICIHAQRFFVHPKHYDAFLNMMKIETEKLIIGDPLKTETQLSNMIDEANAIRVEEWVNEAIVQGAKLIFGGKRSGSYYEPTILINTTTTMKVVSEEVFGPVICVEKYDGTIEDAVKKINDTKFGLQCGVFTNSISELDYCFTTIEVGGIIHNDVPTIRFDQMPYGGIKESGLGREGVKYAIMDMLEAKILVK
ncbi:MAG: aldehyde dehydrogenase family protein [Bacteroidota bacterium]|nr:aldehyde dehydrogenase family protein [Bacteroidota bacterium]MDP3146563.1 aldehyde dehydrogenase family protein [Bacteroidota bacterium]